MNISISERQNLLYNKVFGDGIIESRLNMGNRYFVPTAIPTQNLFTFNPYYEDIIGINTARTLFGTPFESMKSTLSYNNVIAVGGFCAMRTADVNLLQQGKVSTDKESSSIISVDQFTDFLENSVALDQSLEGIGIINARRYIVISEIKSWTDRITSMLGSAIRRQLSSTEIQKIWDSLETAESRRFKIVTRFLQTATGIDSTIERITDFEIWDELERIRQELFKRANTTTDMLARTYKQPQSVIDGLGRVMVMYTQPYMRVLQSKIGESPSLNDLYIISEPTKHTYVSNQALASVMYRELQQNNIYGKQGKNKQTSFAAFMECLNVSGKSSSEFDPVERTVTASNWRNLLLQFSQEEPQIAPGRNPLYIQGLNLLPLPDIEDLLLQLVVIKEDYNTKKDRIQTNGNYNYSRTNIQSAIEDLKKTTIQTVEQINQQLYNLLSKYYSVLFN